MDEALMNKIDHTSETDLLEDSLPFGGIWDAMT